VSAAVDLAHPIGPHTVEHWRSAEHPDDGPTLELIWGYYYTSPPEAALTRLHGVRRPAGLRAHELVGGVYRDRTPVPRDEADTAVILPGPVDIPVDLADLVP